MQYSKACWKNGSDLNLNKLYYPFWLGAKKYMTNLLSLKGRARIVWFFKSLTFWYSSLKKDDNMSTKKEDGQTDTKPFCIIL